MASSTSKFASQPSLSTVGSLSGVTSLISSKPSVLPEDIRLKFSYYASEIKTQVDNLYDDQHKWLEDHLLGVRDTFTTIKQKKHGTRAVMADIIKTPSRKRIQASFKKTNSQPELLRFEPSHQSHKNVHPGSTHSAMNAGSAISNNPSTVLDTSEKCIGNPDVNSLVPSKAHHNHHSSTSDLPVNAAHPSSLPSVLGEVQNGLFQPALSEANKFFKRRASPGVENTRDLDQSSSTQPARVVAMSLKGLGLSSINHMSTAHTQVNHFLFQDGRYPTLTQASLGLLNDEETTALNKSYASPVKKSQLPVKDMALSSSALEPSGSTYRQLNETCGKEKESLEHTMMIYQSASFEQPSADDFQDCENTDVHGEETEVEEDGDGDGPGHELSAIQEGEEEEDLATGDKAKRLANSKPRQSTQRPSQTTRAALSEEVGHVSLDRSVNVLSHSILNSPPSNRVASSSPPIHNPAPVAQDLTSTFVGNSPDVQTAVGNPALGSSTTLKELLISDDTGTNPVQSALDIDKLLTSAEAIELATKMEVTKPIQVDAYTSPALPLTATTQQAPASEADVAVVADANVAEAGQSPKHHDTIVDLPLDDAPSKFRSMLQQSMNSSQSGYSQPSHSDTRTPGPSTHNLFTPGNARAALIRSPQSQWSSRHTASGWASKPNKTPAIPTGAFGVGSTKGDVHKAFAPADSPAPPTLPNPTGLVSSVQPLGGDSTLFAKLQDGSSIQYNSVVDTQGFPTAHRRTSKRTSTDAGFGHSSESQETKMSRSYAPAPLRVRPSNTDKTKKDVDKLMNRLSKIQRESALHELNQHATLNVAPDALTNVHRASLVTSATGPNAKASSRPSQASNSTSTKLSWVPTQPRGLPESLNIPKSQSSRPSPPTANENRPISPTPSTFGTKAVVVVDPAAPFHAGPPAPASAASCPDAASQSLGVSKRSSVGDLVAVYESKKPSTETAANHPAVRTATSPAPSVTLTHMTRSKSPVEAVSRLPLSLSSSAALAFTTTPATTPPLPRSDLGVKVARTRDAASSLCLHQDTDADYVDVSQTAIPHGQKAQRALSLEPVEEDLIDLSEDKSRDPSSNGCARDAETNAAATKDDGDSDGIVSNDDEQNYQVGAQSMYDESPQAQNNEGDEEEEDEDKEEDKEEEDKEEEDARTEHTAEMSPLDSSFHHESNSRVHSNTTPPPEPSEVAKTTPTGGFMGVFKAGAALATSWTTSKNKPELKSLQLAAVAAKKEQEDKERKAAIKEEREHRRIAVVEKKQVEERERAEADRKVRAAETERRKKERDEAAKIRPVTKVKPTVQATPGHQRDVSIVIDPAKKRKVETEPSRTLEPKRAKSQKLEPTPIVRVAPNSALKVSSSSTYQPSRVAPAAPSSVKSATKYHAAAASVGIKSMVEPPRLGYPTPSANKLQPGATAAHSKLPKPSVAGSSKSKTSAVTSQAPPKASQSSAPAAGASSKGKHKQSEEYVELPDIDSEYSDDDEEEHQRKEAALPDWAQSMVMREALANQRKLNPNDIFGATIPAPAMEEIFRGGSSRFRHRTSSANWTGTDQLTAMEEAEYAKRMGYHSKRRSNKDR